MSDDADHVDSDFEDDLDEDQDGGDGERLQDAVEALQRGDPGSALECLACSLDSVEADRFAEEARCLIWDGLLAEAARRINLYLRPKWASLHACREAYADARGRGLPAPDLFGEAA